jgi:hypothetical protein
MKLPPTVDFLSEMAGMREWVRTLFDASTLRLLMKGPHPRLVKLKPSLMTSLLMLAMSTVIWGSVYLLNSALLR